MTLSPDVNYFHKRNGNYILSSLEGTVYTSSFCLNDEHTGQFWLSGYKIVTLTVKLDSMTFRTSNSTVIKELLQHNQIAFNFCWCHFGQMLVHPENKKTVPEDAMSNC